MENKLSRQTVLVVDDTPENIDVLYGLLKSDYKVKAAPNGEKALAIAFSDDPPDVILLDVMMPGIDGFEVCRRLKADPRTAHIPVLMVTALTERDERITGIDAGANDFLTKPVDPQDVTLRVRNAAHAKRLFDEVQENYERLRELEELRDNLTNMIVHDMRSPLTGMLGYLELLGMTALEKLDEREQKSLQGATQAGFSLSEMISSLLDVSRLESGEMPLNLDACDLRSLVSEALNLLGSLVDRTNVVYEPPQKEILANCDAELIRRVISNLAGNSIKYTPNDGEVRITVEGGDSRVLVSVADTGPGIPPDFHERIFEKFGQAEAGKERKKYSTGLGLTFCKLAVEAHGGQIGIESEVGKGSTFWFELPV